MKKISFVFAAALAFAATGCKKKGADCGQAIANSMELSKADMAKMPGVDDKMMAKMRDLGVEHCTADKWSDDAIKCMSDAKTMADAQGCYGKLSAEQRDKMNKAAAAMMTPPSGAGSAAADGSGAMGSDSGSGGSAAAGSAAAGGSNTAAGSAGPAGGSDTAGGSAGSAAAPK
jgi:hypothetical protein